MFTANGNDEYVKQKAPDFSRAFCYYFTICNFFVIDFITK